MTDRSVALRATLLLAALLVATPVLAGSDSGFVGYGVGALLPQDDIEIVNDPSWFVHVRGIQAEKFFGGRGSLYYGDTTGVGTVSGGRVWAVDFEGLLKFGGKKSWVYFFAGAGYGDTTFSREGKIPGTIVRRSEWDWSMNGGIGLTLLKGFYIEANYVQFQTEPKTTFIPVVIGFQY